MTLFEKTFISTENLPIEKRQTTNENEDLPHYVQLLRGRDGRDGRDGVPGLRGLTGRDGKNGEKGMTGDIGPQGPPGPMTRGVTYVRWGRTTCPDIEGTDMLEELLGASTLRKVVVPTINASLKNQQT